MKYAVIFNKSMFNAHKSIARHAEIFKKYHYEIDEIDIMMNFQSLEELNDFLNLFGGRAYYNSKRKEICILDQKWSKTMKLPRAPAVIFYSESNKKNKNRNEEKLNG